MSIRPTNQCDAQTESFASAVPPGGGALVMAVVFPWYIGGGDVLRCGVV